MILNSTGSTVTTVGDVSEHQVSIDAKNIEHIISILSTNLYSKPEQSFLREIVCNAIDAQVEAKSEEPTIISMAYDRNSGKSIISIRDYGTGISPERFEEIYLNIGSSTKRESNDYIGSFGIGRFASLACANMVHVTSYYEGTQYQYVMLKNSAKINIDLIDTCPTTEHNGVEVKISVDSLYTYRDALKYLWFVPNVYVNDITGDTYYYSGIEEIRKFNDRKLCRFKTFAYNNTGDNAMFIMLGNILYPIDYNYVPQQYRYYDDQENVWTKIIPCFEIGELDITPNREQLLYSDKTQKAIKDKYEEVVKELAELCEVISSRNFDNIFEYYKATTDSATIISLPNNSDVEATVRVTKDSFLKKFINYKYNGGDPLANDKEVRRAVGNLRRCGLDAIFNNVIVFEDTGFYTQKQLSGRSKNEQHGYLYTEQLFRDDIDVRLIFVPTTQGLRSDIFKSYLTEKSKQFTKRTMFIFTTDSTLPRKFANKPGLKVTTTADSHVVDWRKTIWLLRELSKSLNGKIYKYDVANSKDFITYRTAILEQRKEERKKAIHKFSSKTRFYYEDYNSGYETGKFDASDIDETIRKVNYYASTSDGKALPVYWGIMDSPYVMIWKSIIRWTQKFVIVTVAKTNIRYLEKAELPSNWHKITPELIQNSRPFRKWMTYKHAFVRPSNIAMEIIELSQDNDTVNELNKVKNWNISNQTTIASLEEFTQLEAGFNSYYDQQMLSAYAIFDKYNQIALSMRGIISLSSDNLYRQNVSPLATYVAMKRKLFRPKWDVYRNIVQTLNVKKEVEINEKDN